MRGHQPNKRFADAIGQSHPVPEHLWHPDQFTFAGLATTLEELAAHDVSFTSVRELNATLAEIHADDELKDLFNDSRVRAAALTFPVLFSPSQAVQIAKIVKSVDNEFNVSMSGVFLFESGSPSYQLDSPETRNAMHSITLGGFDIGIMLAVNPGESVDQAVTRLSETLPRDLQIIQDATGKKPDVATFRSVGVPAETTLGVAKALEPLLAKFDLVTPYAPAFQDKERVHTSVTSNGLYKGGHPVIDYAKGKTPFSVVQIIPDWYSQEPLWALDRLGRLPEVEKNTERVISDYLAHLKTPILGQNNTIEPVSETVLHSVPTAGFRAQRHEMH